MPARNPVTAAITLLALPGANAFGATCGATKGDYRGSTCCGNPDKTLQSLENFCPSALMGPTESLVIEQKEKGKDGPFFMPTKTVLGAATFTNSQLKTSTELDAMMNSADAATNGLAAIKAGYVACAHMDAALTNMTIDRETNIAAVTVDLFAYASLASTGTTPYTWGQSMQAKIRATQASMETVMGPMGEMMPIMSHMCVMHGFFKKGVCGAAGENCQATPPALGEDSQFIMDSVLNGFQLGHLYHSQEATPMSNGTKSDTMLGGSIESLAAYWNSMFVFPSGFIYSHNVKRVYTCDANSIAKVALGKFKPDPTDKMMTMFSNSGPYYSKVTKNWNMQQALSFQVELHKRTKSGFFSVHVSAERDLQFVYQLLQNGIAARDCEFPDSDALIWTPLGDNDYLQAGIQYYMSSPGYNPAVLDLNQPLDWLVRAQTYTPAMPDMSTDPPSMIPAVSTGAKLNTGFPELKMYGLLQSGKVKKILASADCAMIFVVGFTEPDSPTVPFPPSRDFLNTNCDLPEDTFGSPGRSGSGPRYAHYKSPMQLAWDKI